MRIHQARRYLGRRCSPCDSGHPRAAAPAREEPLHPASNPLRQHLPTGRQTAGQRCLQGTLSRRTASILSCSPLRVTQDDGGTVFLRQTIQFPVQRVVANPATGPAQPSGCGMLFIGLSRDRRLRRPRSPGVLCGRPHHTANSRGVTDDEGSCLARAKSEKCRLKGVLGPRGSRASGGGRHPRPSSRGGMLKGGERGLVARHLLR